MSASQQSSLRHSSRVLSVFQTEQGGLASNRRINMREIRQFSGLFWSVITILAFQFIVGIYAVALNALFYANFGPFYDSLAYDNSIAAMQIDAKSVGTLSALSRAIYSTTVVYPWVLFAPFAKYVSASRAVGVWIQIFAAGCMQITLLIYFLKVKGRTWPESIVFSAAFILIPAAFDFDGGLGDFRMDLLQYFLFTTVMASYLITRESQALGWAVLLGVNTGLLCLARATSAVYIAPIFAICAAIDLINGDNRRLIFLKWLVTTAVATALAGWYFISNFSHLYYYYVVWNTDANAHLPLSKSVMHIKFAKEHIGVPLLVALAFIGAYTCIQAIRVFGARVLGHINWRPLLFSALPLAYLVFSGSGLNPFVSIVGVGGVMLFLLDPIKTPLTPSHPPLTTLLAAVLLFTGCFVAAGGITRNSSAVPNWMPRREGVDRVVDAITSEMTHVGHHRLFTYAVMYDAGLNQDAIFNTLFFDKHTSFNKDRVASFAGSTLAAIWLGCDVATAVEWSNVPGASDDEKIDFIIRMANDNVDFVVAPSPTTILPVSVYGNHYVGEIYRRLTGSGLWEQIAGPIVIAPTENAIVLRNRKRMELDLIN